MATLHDNRPDDDRVIQNRANRDWVEQDWLERAACKGKTTLFFGIAGERPERRVRREAAARRICATCPALLQCRAVARANRENGFWGGESEEERAAAGYPPRSISRRAVQEAATGGGQVSPAARAAASA